MHATYTSTYDGGRYKDDYGEYLKPQDLSGSIALRYKRCYEPPDFSSIKAHIHSISFFHCTFSLSSLNIPNGVTQLFFKDCFLLHGPFKEFPPLTELHVYQTYISDPHLFRRQFPSVIATFSDSIEVFPVKTRAALLLDDGFSVEMARRFLSVHPLCEVVNLIVLSPRDAQEAYDLFKEFNQLSPLVASETLLAKSISSVLGAEEFARLVITGFENDEIRRPWYTSTPLFPRNGIQLSIYFNEEEIMEGELDDWIKGYPV
jgi:hypothetical protein